MSETAINPNTPVVGETTPTETTAGDGPRTFEELERAMQSKKQADRHAEPKKETSSKKGDDDAKGDKSKDLSSDTDKGKKAQSEKKESKGAKEKEDDAPEEEAPKPKKTLKYKRGEEEADLDEDVVFTALINGKPEEVTIRDLINNYSGKVNWDRKYSESHRKGQEFESKYTQVQNKIKAAFEEKDPELRMWKMAEVANVDPIKFKKFYLDDNMPLLEKYYSMSEEERNAYFQGEENRYLKAQVENLSKADQARISQEKTLSEINKLRQAHNVDEGEFWDNFESLAAWADQGKLKHEGITSRSQITPQRVMELVQKERLWAPLAEAMAATNLPEDKHAAAIGDLIDMGYANGLTADDLKDIVSNLYGAKKQQARIEKTVEKAAEFKHGTREAPKPKKEALLFSDL